MHHQFFGASLLPDILISVLSRIVISLYTRLLLISVMISKNYLKERIQSQAEMLLAIFSRKEPSNCTISYQLISISFSTFSMIQRAPSRYSTRSLVLDSVQSSLILYWRSLIYLSLIRTQSQYWPTFFRFYRETPLAGFLVFLTPVSSFLSRWICFLATIQSYLIYDFFFSFPIYTSQQFLTRLTWAYSLLSQILFIQNSTSSMQSSVSESYLIFMSNSILQQLQGVQSSLQSILTSMQEHIFLRSGTLWLSRLPFILRGMLLRKWISLISQANYPSSLYSQVPLISSTSLYMVLWAQLSSSKWAPLEYQFMQVQFITFQDSLMCFFRLSLIYYSLFSQLVCDCLSSSRDLILRQSLSTYFYFSSSLFRSASAYCLECSSSLELLCLFYLFLYSSWYLSSSSYDYFSSLSFFYFAFSNYFSSSYYSASLSFFISSAVFYLAFESCFQVIASLAYRFFCYST